MAIEGKRACSWLEQRLNRVNFVGSSSFGCLLVIGLARTAWDFSFFLLLSTEIDKLGGGFLNI